jgi:hypothetical protein
VSGVIFAPLLWALYQDGSIVFLTLSALLWLHRQLPWPVRGCSPAEAR